MSLIRGLRNWWRYDVLKKPRPMMAQIVAKTIENRSRSMVDNIERNNAMLKRLRQTKAKA